MRTPIGGPRLFSLTAISVTLAMRARMVEIRVDQGAFCALLVVRRAASPAAHSSAGVYKRDQLHDSP